MKYAVAFVAALLLTGTAIAQHKHADKGPNGGQMQDLAGVHAELLTSGNSITVNVFDESTKPVATKGFSGAALVVNGADRETVTLSPAGESAIKGEAKKPIANGASITVTLKTDSGKSGQAKFAK